MLSVEECLIEADNLALAARVAKTDEARSVYIRLSAIYRNQALRARLGSRAGMLDRKSSRDVRF